MSERKMLALPQEETEYLDSRFTKWESITEGQNWILIDDFPVPEGYNVRKVKAAISIPKSYPFAKLDMVYFHPVLSRADGKAIPATQCSVTVDGKSYQRWSRHYREWDPESDSVITHIMAVDDWLLREFRVRC